MSTIPASARRAQLAQLRQLRRAKDGTDRDRAEPTGWIDTYRLEGERRFRRLNAVLKTMKEEQEP